MDSYSPLFQLVRPQKEHVKIAIDVTLPSQSAATGKTSDRTYADAKEGERCIFAILSNVERGYEECCVLVCKRRRKDAKQVKVIDGFAIGSDLNASIQQSRTKDGSSGSQLQIVMNSRGKTLSGLSDDSQGIKDLLSVIRDAAETASQQKVPPSHQWMDHYVDTASSSSSSSSSSKPSNDGKHTGQDVPIFSRFTSSSVAPLASPPSRPRPPSPTEKEVRVSIGTYNVNGQMSGDADLQAWLHVVDDEPDILVVGLQEAESSNLSYVVWTPHVEADWSAAVESAMGRRRDEYYKLTSKQLVGVLILVYVRKETSSRISGLATSSTGIGFGGWVANKGAVAVRFDLDGLPICLVNSHLSASDTMEARERRRWDYTEIVKRMRFTLYDNEAIEANLEEETQRGEEEKEEGEKKRDREQERDAEAMLRAQLDKDAIFTVDDRTDLSWADDSQRINKRQLAIMDHDVIFWTGDLNFRLELGIGEVKRLIQKRQFESALLNFDQLRSEMQAKTCFQGFEEQKITFAPTYKFDRGSDIYDTSEKKRVPSWTDRVLWKQSRSLVQPIHYESCPTVRISDHKPVLATFVLRLDKMQ